MSTFKPLTRDELTERDDIIIDFEQQEMQTYGTKGQRQPYIWTTCPDCGAERWQPIYPIRRGASTFCPSCRARRRQVKLLRPKEIIERDDVIVDFQKQELQFAGKNGRKQLRIWATCPDCGFERWVHVSGIRNDNNSTLCPPCAAKHSRARGPDHSAWKGGIQITNGYRAVMVTTLIPEDQQLVKAHLKTHRGYVYEHRLVALKTFGPEAVGPGIVIRHLDGDKLNNDPTNLAYGSQKQNCSDHVQAQKEAILWRGIALTLLRLLSQSE